MVCRSLLPEAIFLIVLADSLCKSDFMQSGETTASQSDDEAGYVSFGGQSIVDR